MASGGTGLTKRMAMHWKKKTINPVNALLKLEDIVNAIVEQPLLLDKRPIQRTDKVEVHVKAVFSKIGEISTTKQSFYAEVFLQAKWREPLLDGQMHINKSTIKWGDYWNPKLYVENALGEGKESTWQTVAFSSDAKAFLCERRKLKGLFSETMELEHFPFDTQDLSCIFMSERSCSEISLIKDPEESSLVSQNSFVKDQEWRVYNYIDVQLRDIAKVYENSGRVLHPSVTFVCRTMRRYQFYLYNFIFVLFIINSMTFASFSVSLEKPENRLQLTFILLLTTVSFRTNINNTLPKISYLTRMDHIILSSFGIQCTVCVWHSVIATVKNPSLFLTNLASSTGLTQDQSPVTNGSQSGTTNPGTGITPAMLDRFVLIALSLAYTGLHVIFAYVVGRQRTSKYNEFKEKEKLAKHNREF